MIRPNPTQVIERPASDEGRLRDELERLAHIGSWAWHVAANRVTWSDELYRIYGLEPGSIEVTFEAYLSRVHEEDRPRIVEHVQAALARGGAFEYEERILRPDGAVRYLRSRGEVVTDGAGQPVRMIGTCQDITVEKAAEEHERQLLSERIARQEAELAQRRLRELFQQAPAAIALTVGPEHRFELANPAYVQLSGRDPLGKTMREAFPEAQVFLTLLDRAFATGEPYAGQEMPVHFAADDGPGQRWFNFVYQPIRDGAGRVYGIMTHAVEVTEQVEARRAVERQAAELAQLTRALERSNTELDQFAYVASHDLKAPLRGIASLSAWIEEDLSDAASPELRRNLDLLRSRVQRLESLIDGILAYARVGRSNGHAEPVDLEGLVAETIDLLAVPADVEVRKATALPVVTGTRTSLQQVFQNLLGNALKHNRAERRWIEVGAREHGAAWELWVGDNGPGIAPQFHERIWGIFQTLRPRDEVEGTGIGLALVKKIVEGSGGRVWLESEPGRGATFRFTWPKNGGIERFL